MRPFRPSLRCACPCFPGKCAATLLSREGRRLLCCRSLSLGSPDVFSFNLACTLRKHQPRLATYGEFFSAVRLLPHCIACCRIPRRTTSLSFGGWVAGGSAGPPRRHTVTAATVRALSFPQCRMERLFYFRARGDRARAVPSAKKAINSGPRLL